MQDKILTDKYIFYRDLKRDYPLIVRGDGIYIYDDKGEEIIDGVSGAAVVCLGHNNKRVMDAWMRQSKKISFVHMSAFSNEPILELSERLVNMVGDKHYHVYFTSGGSESVEAAMKLARQYHLEKGQPERHKVIARSISYHGSTLGALSLTGHHYRRYKFAPILFSFPRVSPPYCYRCPFNQTKKTCNLDCAEDLERAIVTEGEELISAFIFEPVVGAAAPGIAPPVGYIKRIREICENHDVLMIGDEVMSGVGRTGKFLASQNYHARSHIICLSKGISSGYAPLGAVMVEDEVYDVLKSSGTHAFVHGHTFGGHPSSVAVGVEVLKILKDEKLIEHVSEMGKYWIPRLKALKKKHKIVGSVRGKGLLIGIEFVENNRKGKEPFESSLVVRMMIKDECLKRGLYIYPGGYSVKGIAGDHILLAPPFIINKNELDNITEILDDAIGTVERKLE